MDRPPVKICPQPVGKLGSIKFTVLLTQIIEALLNKAKFAFTLRRDCNMVLPDLRPTALNLMGSY